MTTPVNQVLIDGLLAEEGGVLSPGYSSAPGVNPPSATESNNISISASGGINAIADWTVISGANDDTINANGSLRTVELSGELGDDVINVTTSLLGGSISFSTIRAGEGDDAVTIIANGVGSTNSSFLAGAGEDEVNLLGNYSSSEVGLAEGDDTLNFQSAGNFSFSEIRGGQGADQILDNGNVINLAQSTVRGGGEADLINFSSSTAGVGVQGALLTSGNGNDTVYGTFTGENTLLGGQGADFIQAFDGDDSIVGGGDDDILIAGFGNDTVYGDVPATEGVEAAGNDIIFAIAGSNTIFAGAGTDFVAGGVNDDYAEGNDGNDTLAGGAGNDTILGGDGADIIFGSNITAQTGGGFVAPNLYYVQGTTDDLADVAAKVRAQYTANELLANGLAVGSPVIPISGLNPLGFNDRAIGDANAPFDNSLVGGKGADLIFGGNGDDNIQGNIGNDTIIGGVGADILSGGIGNDIFVQGLVDDPTQDASSIAATTAVNTGNWTFNWTQGSPDIITDFTATAGSNIVDQIAFSGTGANALPASFVTTNVNQNSIYNATGSASFDYTAATAGNIVLYRGTWTNNNTQFVTNNNGDDALVFVASSSSSQQSAVMDNQAVILLGAGGQDFVGGNFFGSFTSV